MKKVAGTLKLDQAQYRELEAFSKFGSDLDAVTKSVLDKGARNVEILKQPQYSPLTVEQQVAIIYCGSKGLLQKIPVKRVHDFEIEFLHHLAETKKPLLESLRKGQYTPEIEKELDALALDLVKKYEV